MRIIVKEDKCVGCGQCIDSCPYTAIEMKNEKAVINDYCQFCRTCLGACPEGAISEIAEEGDSKKADLAGYHGVWVFAEQRHGEIASVVYELLGAGRRLADELGTELSSVLLGAPESSAGELISCGSDKVYVSSDPILQDFNDEPYSQLMTKLIQTHKPEIVLAGAT